jgi:hypothetical protein
LCSVLPPLPVPTTQNYYSRFAFTERDDWTAVGQIWTVYLKLDGDN